MKNQNFILENEYDVNRVMLKIFNVLLFMIPLILIFKALNVFIVPWKVIIIVSVFIGVFGGIPTFLFKDIKNRNIKLYTTLCFLVFSTLIYSFVFVNGIFFMLIPSLIALLYFDSRLLKIVFLGTIPLMMIAEFFASLSKQEFIANIKWIPLHFLVFSMQFSIILILLLNLANRAKKMLNDTNDLLKKNSILYKSICNSSKEISEDVTELYHNFYETNKSSKQVESSIAHISEKTEVFYLDIKNVVADSKEISGDIEDIYKITSDMKKGTTYTERQLDDNINNVAKVIKKFKDISESTETAKFSVNRLFDEIKEIHRAINLMEKIQKQTNVLSVNASIEASKAGESGKGFAVVADNIKYLAIKSNEYIDVIKKQLKQVENNSIDTVKKMDESYFYVEEGMKNISSLEDFFDFIRITLSTTKDKISNLNEYMNILEIKEKRIDIKIDNINSSNEEVINNILSITSSIEELTTTFNNNVNLLKNIEVKSKELINSNE